MLFGRLARALLGFVGGGGLVGESCEVCCPLNMISFLRALDTPLKLHLCGSIQSIDLS